MKKFLGKDFHFQGTKKMLLKKNDTCICKNVGLLCKALTFIVTTSLNNHQQYLNIEVKLNLTSFENWQVR